MAKNLAPLGCKIGFLLSSINPALLTAVLLDGAAFCGGCKIGEMIVDEIEEREEEGNDS